MRPFLKNNAILLLFALTKVAATLLLIHPDYDLQRDEYLYLDQANHLAWGYLEVPPMLSVFSWLTKILGGSAFVAHLWMALLGGLTVFMTGKIAARLGGGYFAQSLACIAVLFSPFLRVHILYQPNSLDIFCWTMVCYYLVCFIQIGDGISNPAQLNGLSGYNKSAQNKYLMLIGIWLGLGVLCKYSIGFLMMGLFLGTLATRHRRLFINPYFYGSLLIAFLICAPNLWWQYAHRFPTFHHFNELYDTQLKFISPLQFLFGQVLILAPALFIWLSGLFFTLFAKAGKPYRLFGFAYLGVIGALMFLHGKDYYSLGIYPTMIAFGAVYLARLTESGRAIHLRPVLVAIPVLICLYVFPLLIPFLAPTQMAQVCKKFEGLGVLRWEDLKNHPLPQDYADMLGWKEMAAKAAKAYQGLSTQEKAGVFVHCDNYGEAGALNFYGKPLGLPEAHSLNSSYRLWMPDKPQVERILLVTEAGSDIDTKLPHFGGVVLCDSVTNPLAREYGTRIFLLAHPDSSAINAYYGEIAQKKGLFN